jgi:hypothetical protein
MGARSVDQSGCFGTIAVTRGVTGSCPRWHPVTGFCVAPAEVSAFVRSTEEDVELHG